MNLKFSNYNKPSQPLYRNIGDMCLFAIPLYLSILAPLPIDNILKLWIGGGLGFMLATVKIITKFTIDSTYFETIQNGELFQGNKVILNKEEQGVVDNSSTVSVNKS